MQFNRSLRTAARTILPAAGVLAAAYYAPGLQPSAAEPAAPAATAGTTPAHTRAAAGKPRKSTPLPVTDMQMRMTGFVQGLQDEIVMALEEVDGGKFIRDSWEREEGGYGQSCVLQDSAVFTKAGVNVSVIHGTLPPSAVASMRSRGKDLQGENPPFFVAGISLVLHPRNPHAPTTHANFRYFEALSVNPETGERKIVWWFGGGADLTPSYLYEEDAVHFHQTLANACAQGGKPEWYPRFKAWCDKYFWLKHRGEARGVGGVFFDDVDASEAAQADAFKFTSSVGKSFLAAYMPILQRRKDMKFTDQEQAWQAIRAGRYAEFNLVWDRGTKFGLATPGARIESILMSLPLHASWKYMHQPPGEREAKLMEVLQHPRDWVSVDSRD